MPLPLTSRRRQQGVSLVIVMIMLVVIALTSAAAIRSASSNERATRNFRMENLARLYAEASLKYCEAELAKSDDARAASLQEERIVHTTAADGEQWAWQDAATWTGNTGAARSRTALPAAGLRSAISSFAPSKAPECVVERLSLTDGSAAYAITARGFSPDYAAAPSGATTSGSVVWMQSIVLLK